MNVDLAHCDLVLMDLQQDVADPVRALAAAPDDQTDVDAAVAACARLRDCARTSGTPVVHVAVRFGPGHPEIVSEVPLLRAARETGAMVEGSWGADVQLAGAPIWLPYPFNGVALVAAVALSKVRARRAAAEGAA